MKLLKTLNSLEWAVVVAAALPLLFPTLRPALTGAVLAFLAVVWVVRWSAIGEPWPVTPLNGALLLLSLMIPVGMWASAFPELTLPKATGLILGLAVLRAVALTVRSRRDIALAVAAYSLLGLVITVAGALSVNWSAKVAALGVVAGRIPQLIEGLPSMPEGGVNPNQLAGVLTLYLPLVAALAVWAWTRRTARRWLGRLVTLALLALMATMLALTQSRTGWVGGVAGLGALAVLAGATSSSRRKRLAAIGAPVVLLAALGVVVLLVGPRQVAQVLDGGGGAPGMADVVRRISMAGRVEIWSRALYAMQDFPFTGCGLGTFREVVHILYPLFLISPNTDIAHAHNIFLQTALDVGFPGLIAYLALLFVALALCWRAARRGEGASRAAALGLAAGLVGLHVYGLADALALGSKPAVAFWFALGLVAAMEPGARGDRG